jgi:hypothetical protein
MIYRLFFYNEHGHTHKIEEIDAVSDQHAREFARALLDGHAIEVWQSVRQVVRLEVDGSESIASEDQLSTTRNFSSKVE